jgi:hypothetical protein
LSERRARDGGGKGESDEKAHGSEVGWRRVYEEDHVMMHRVDRVRHAIMS